MKADHSSFCQWFLGQSELATLFRFLVFLPSQPMTFRCVFAVILLSVFGFFFFFLDGMCCYFLISQVQYIIAVWFLLFTCEKNYNYWYSFPRRHTTHYLLTPYHCHKVFIVTFIVIFSELSWHLILDAASLSFSVAAFPSHLPSFPTLAPFSHVICYTLT